ncbi:phosphatidylserine decarboxylase, partial [Escherichia coli]|nr:phosphatidylserine decarboxylase [Escherichia coli]
AGAIFLKKGEEMGRFKLGSTVINLFPENTVQLNKDLMNGSVTLMGEQLGSIINVAGNDNNAISE